MTYWELLATVAMDDIVEIGFKCAQADCIHIARYVTTWPVLAGQPPMRCCEVHLPSYERIAAGLGMAFSSFPSPVKSREAPIDEAALRFAQLELT